MSVVKRIDIIGCVALMTACYTFGKGYAAYTGGGREHAVFWAAACAAALLLTFRRAVFSHYRHMRLKKVDRLSGRRFEKYLRVQFCCLGYRVKFTEKSHDYGADLLLKKWGETVVVQAKRYEKNVGIAAVQEAVGAVAYYGADRAMVVTNSGFTKSARDLARKNEVELWGRAEICRKFDIRK